MEIIAKSRGNVHFLSAITVGNMNDSLPLHSIHGKETFFGLHSTIQPLWMASNHSFKAFTKKNHHILFIRIKLFMKQQQYAGLLLYSTVVIEYYYAVQNISISIYLFWSGLVLYGINGDGGTVCMTFDKPAQPSQRVFYPSVATVSLTECLS